MRSMPPSSLSSASPPLDPQRVTIEQLTALRTQHDEYDTLFCDFGVWLPYRDRQAKRAHFAGKRMDARGQWVNIELYGPPSYVEWEASYLVFRTGALKLDYLYSVTIEAYMARIKEWDRIYPGCWDLIYQADIRARKEYAGILKAAAMVAKARAIEHNQYHALEEAKPWDFVFTQLAFGEDAWWERTLIRYCSMVTTGSGTVSQYLAGDVLTSSRPAVLDPPMRTHQKRAADSHDQPPPPPQRIDKHVITYDNAEDDGPPFSENRRGKRLCPGFNGDGCD